MLLSVARALLLRGHELRVLNFEGLFGNERRFSREELAQRLEPAQFESVPPFPLLGRFLPLPSFEGVRTLSRAFRWADVVVFGQYYAFDVVMLVLGRLLHRPVVCSQANALFRELRDDPKDAVQEAYARLLGARLLLFCDAVRVCNVEDLRFLQRAGHSHAVLLYPLRGDFAPVTGEDVNTTQPGSLAAKLREDPRFKILIAGRMTHQKGIDMVAKVAQLLCASEPDASRSWVFYLAGSAAWPRELAAFRNSAPGLFVHLGVLPRHDFSTYLDGVDVVMVPSRYESFGMVAAEAQSRGVPVLATNITGLRDSVADRRSGILVREWTPQAFLEGLRELRRLKRDEPELWKEMRVAAQQQSMSVLSPQRQAVQFDRFVETLHEVVQESGR